MARGYGTPGVVPAGTARQAMALEWYQAINAFFTRFIRSRSNPNAPATITLRWQHRSGGNDDEFEVVWVEGDLNSNALRESGVLRGYPTPHNAMEVMAAIFTVITDSYTPPTPKPDAAPPAPGYTKPPKG